MTKVLLGFMGAGKTTLGHLLDPDFSDMDALLTEQIGQPIQDFFAQEGETAFRRLESQLLQDLLEQQVPVISTGGGVVLAPYNRQLLAQNDCNIFLKLDFDRLYQRLQADQEAKRPLFLNHSRQEFQKIFEERQALYEAVATHTIEVLDKSPQEIAEMIQCL
ncbi:shikimate kinase [Streptococcus oricebi]|uniref:Shikimate kinase n=1 Tax=Streptococcus oricebi TaxID=1547447 RepID=A0ABS5B2I7_9STRE|nr:shikimate kinase [Streptococcus oricebi]MBP2623037.1 shikimate kinase [Streptococcus oricebi]